MHQHAYTLLYEVGGVLLALGILGRFAGRLGVSPIPLYLLAGLAFGHGGLLPLSCETMSRSFNGSLARARMASNSTGVTISVRVLARGFSIPFTVATCIVSGGA